MSTFQFIGLITATLILFAASLAIGMAYVKRKVRHLERQMGLWALLMSCDWEVTETGRLIEWRVDSDGKPVRSMAGRRFCDLMEIKAPLGEVAAGTGDRVRFSVVFLPPDRPHGAALSAHMVNRVPKQL